MGDGRERLLCESRSKLLREWKWWEEVVWVLVESVVVIDLLQGRCHGVGGE